MYIFVFILLSTIFDVQQKETKKDNDNNVAYFNIFEKK